MNLYLVGDDLSLPLVYLSVNEKCIKVKITLEST